MTISRRTFLAATCATPWALPAVHAGGRAPANERIAVGIVGLGSRGFNLIDALLSESDAQIVAICDVDALHYRDQPWGKGRAYGRQPARQRIDSRYASKGRTGSGGVAVYRDYRDLCRHEDLDAVVVATPDHWHALVALEALRAGCHVYCEKPITHRFAEGVRLCEEVERRKAVFQVGSQQRSDARFRRAVEIVRNGHLGEIQRVEVGLPSGYEHAQGDTRITPPPDHLDYDLWCGPAPRLPYMRARHHRWWRGHSAFGGGVLMDWIGHHNDIAQWGLGMERSGPLEVEAVDWAPSKTEVYDTPWHYTIRCRYAGGVITTISDGNAMGVRWIGSDGWLYVRRGKWQASRAEWLEPDFKVGSWRLPKIASHMRNFLDGIRSHKECTAPPDIALRSITPGFLGYVSCKLGRPLRWDAKEQRVEGDAEADRQLREVTYRSPWKLG